MPARPVTGSTAMPNGMAAGSSSWTREGSNSTWTIPSRLASRPRPAWPPRGGRLIFVVDAATGMTAPDAEAAESCGARRPPSSSRSTRPTTSGASSKAPSSTPWAGTSSMRFRGPRARHRRPPWTRWSGPCRPRPKRKSRGRHARRRPRNGRRRSPPVISTRTSSATPRRMTRTRTMPARPDLAGGHGGREVGRGDGRGEGRRTGRDRVRRPPERRQVAASSTRCSARTGRSSRTCPARRATRSTPLRPAAAASSC